MRHPELAPSGLKQRGPAAAPRNQAPTKAALLHSPKASSWPFSASRVHPKASSQAFVVSRLSPKASSRPFSASKFHPKASSRPFSASKFHPKASLRTISASRVTPKASSRTFSASTSDMNSDSEPQTIAVRYAAAASRTRPAARSSTPYSNSPLRSQSGGAVWTISSSFHERCNASCIADVNAATSRGGTSNPVWS
jgi:hypothetical protein